MKIAVLGIGNILLKDEGVGVRVLEALKEKFVFSKNVELIDGGTMGLDLLPFIEGNDKVLFVDAVDLKEKAGAIKTIEGKDVPSFLATKLSVHQIGIPDMIFAAEFMGITPPEMCLIGIQPKEVAAGLEMSDEINERFDELVDVVKCKLLSWGEEVSEKDNVPCSAV